MKKYQDKLIAQIAAFDGQPVNTSKWFMYFSLDIMGDLAFGTSFKMLETSEEHWAIDLLNKGLAPLSWMSPIWFLRLMAAIPGTMRQRRNFIRYCAQRLDERMSVSPI